ncbi:MAG TPA: hypothetical protein VEB21_14095 [Terriglobales bacterium]|nr:hypothetical protein [Terriglobales bacterium]
MIELRHHARLALQAGRVPRRMPDRTWGGAGRGDSCAVCDQPISSAEMELEVEFAQDGRPLDSYHLHIACCSAWMTELSQAHSATMSNSRASQPASPSLRQIAAEKT